MKGGKQIKTHLHISKGRKCLSAANKPLPPDFCSRLFVYSDPISPSCRLAELSLPDLPTHVELHELQAAQRVREEHWGGHRSGPELQLRLLAGEHHEWVLPPEELQPDSNWRAARHQGLRHRHATGWVGNGGRERRYKWERADFYWWSKRRRRFGVKWQLQRLRLIVSPKWAVKPRKGKRRIVEEWTISVALEG